MMSCCSGCWSALKYTSKAAVQARDLVSPNSSTSNFHSRNRSKSFGFDVVGLVCSYASFSHASADTKPETLVAIRSPGVLGMACSADGKIWLAAGNAVSVFDADGSFQFSAAPSQWHLASGIACAPNGLVHIADSTAHRLVTCSPDGSVVREMGSFGSGNAHFNSIVDVAVDPKTNTVFVTDSGNRRVKVLSETGQFLRTLGGKRKGAVNFGFPSGIATGVSGQIAVTDATEKNVQVFDTNGRHLRTFGGRGCEQGQFQSVSGIAADSAGNWIVSDAVGQRASIFKADGSFLTSISNGSKFNSVCVHNDGRILLGDGGAQVFVFGFVSRFVDRN